VIGFLHPWVLLGLAAAGFPLLLHLLARREPPALEFPAVRYLMETARRHERRLKVQNYLLLILRTLLVLALVLGASGPHVDTRLGAGHVPGALVLVVDNSLSSGAVVDGVPVLTQLREAAGRVLSEATPADTLWLLTADGIPRRGSPEALRQSVAGLSPLSLRMDLGEALRTAEDVLRGSGQIVVVSDFQLTALSALPALSALSVLAVRPSGSPPANWGVTSIDPGHQPWTTDGGAVRILVSGPAQATAPLTLRVGDRPARRGLASAGVPLGISSPTVPAGWWPVAAELDPDEVRADDRRVTAVRVLPVAGVAWPSDEPYLLAAAEVLQAGGRFRRGSEVALGFLGPNASVVEPPKDPAGIEVLNRRLGERGVAWRYGRLSLEAVASDSGELVGRERVLRRYGLEPVGNARTGVLATAGGAPWIVRSGRVVLIGSRLDPEWTSLPVSAAFIPLLDALVNRMARGEVATVETAPGDPAPVPDLATEVRAGNRTWPVEGGARFRPPEPGIYYFLAGRDTLGALSVNPDPRESELTRATDSQIRGLWPGTRIVSTTEAATAGFFGSARADLTGPLLWLALTLGLVELLVASGRGSRA
jgi:hypothetical protein